ncbi:MAG TPA: hypothetical protein VG167_14960 [Verrucomicrobiae bacterium]|nr:hypothetical protein [Verrucomicrobiae bacterium]
MADPTQEAGQTLAEAAAGAVAPDPLTAELLAKHSAGQPLTPSQYGKLGAFAKRLKAAVGLGGANPGAGPAPAGPGAAPGVGTVPPDQAQAGGVAPVPVDPLVIKRTTAAILKGGETLAQRYVSRAARATGANDQTVGRFVSSASIPQVTGQLVTDVSPDAAQMLGEMLGVEDLRLYPVAAAVAALGLYATNLWLLVDELHAMAEKRPAPTVGAPGASPAQTPPQQAIPAARSVMARGPVQPGQQGPIETLPAEPPPTIVSSEQPIVLPDPAQPKGAPPTFT